MQRAVNGKPPPFISSLTSFTGSSETGCNLTTHSTTTNDTIVFPRQVSHTFYILHIKTWRASLLIWLTEHLSHIQKAPSTDSGFSSKIFSRHRCWWIPFSTCVLGESLLVRIDITELTLSPNWTGQETPPYIFIYAQWNSALYKLLFWVITHI